MVAPSSPHDSPVPAAPATSDLVSLLWSQDLGRQHGFEPLVVEGRLPPQLHGTLYRNGPAQFGQFGGRYAHPFEGDGGTTAIRINGGKATGASIVHNTRGLVEERAAGKVLYGMSASWPRRVANTVRGKSKNTANTNVVMWQGRLFALMEAGLPTEIDPQTLETLEPTNLGVIEGGMFSAHPHRVASRKASYNFGLEYGRKTTLHLYELPDAGRARHLGGIELAGPPMLHDFIATDTHLVFFVSPVRIHVPRMLLSIGDFRQLFQWQPQHGTDVIAVPIDQPDEPVRFTVEAFYQWHFGNAFTRGNSVVIDYIRYPDFASFSQFGDSTVQTGRFHRATLDLSAQTLHTEQVSDRACEFPTLVPGEEGREHAITYMTFDDLRAVGSIDAHGTVASHTLPDNELVTEPLYTDGHVLALCHVHDRAYVAVYDAARIPDGPIAKIWLDHHVPITFHGTFVRS